MKKEWELFSQGAELIGIISNDFEHDVVLRVEGDFETPQDRLQYCRKIANKLNEESGK